MIKWVVAGLVLVILAASFGLRLRARSSDASGAGGVTTMPVPADQVVIGVRGWTRPELDRILADFADMYRSGDGAFQVEALGENGWKVRLPHGLPADQIVFLVNYLHYPKGFDLKQRHIGVLAVVTLGEAFGVPDPALLLQQGAIYIPANDREYDQAYIATRTHGVYRVPFTDLRWHPESDAQMATEVIALRSALGG